MAPEHHPDKTRPPEEEPLLVRKSLKRYNILMIAALLKKISGDWYNENIYFKYRIHKMSPWKRMPARFIFLPMAFGRRLNKVVRDRLEIPGVEMSIITPCNPHCRDCESLNPLHPQPVAPDLDRLIRDASDFLFHVDRVHRLMITGSEPFAYREFPALLTYLLGQDKIDLVHLITRGSVLPGPDILQLLKHRKILVTISSYPAEDSPDKPRFIAAMEENSINYMVKDIWRDLGSFNPVADGSLDAMKHRFARCVSRVHNLNGGEYHLCPRSAHGRQLRQFSPDKPESIVYRDRKNPQAFKNEMRQLLRKKYLTACRQCGGSRRETKIDVLLQTLLGRWYNENIYYKYRIHKMSPWRQDAARLFFLPPATAIKLISMIRRRLEIPHIELPITTRCNLRCKDCGNLIPFYPHPADFDVEHLIGDVDDFLNHVHRVHRFIVMGGETFLYRELHRLLSHLIQQNKIGLLHLFTNGSIIPGAKILQLLKHRKILVSVSSFPAEVSPNKARFIDILEENHINYKIEDHLWRDLGGFNPDVDSRPETLRRRFANCSIKGCHNLSNGEYHLCPRSVHGGQLGQFVPDASDKVVIRNRKDPHAFKKERQALLRKEYLAACSRCTGKPGETVYPGIQLSGGVAFIIGKNDRPSSEAQEKNQDISDLARLKI